MLNTLPILPTFSEARKKTQGAKRVFLLAMITSMAASFTLASLPIILPPLPFSSISADAASNALISLIAHLLQSLFEGGLAFLALSRAQGNPISYDLLFYAFRKNVAWKIIGASLLLELPFISNDIFPLQNTFLFIIFTLFLLYLTHLRFGFALLAILDKGFNLPQALKYSYSITKGHTCALVGIYLASFIIVIISALPLGLGLIWTIPWLYVLYGVVYQKLSYQSAPIT